MRVKNAVWLLVLCLGVVFHGKVAGAEDERIKNAKEAPFSGIKSKNVIFDVADDRRIEVRGAFQEPESLDKYMKRKFESVQEELKLIREKLDVMQKQLDTIAKK
jgi:hypothetical protein